MDRSSPSTAKVRAGTVAELETVLQHRHAMFAEMGFPADSLAAMDREARPYFLQAFADDTYHHWFIDRENGGPSGVAAGAGVSLNRFYPGPRDPRPQRAWILNVYTEPDCRRHGMAGKLVETAIGWCRQNGFRSVYLHSSQYGISLYESLGFVSSNEMRLDLGP